MNELPWDGSYLGIIKKEDILEVFQNILDYYRILIYYQGKQIQIVAIIRRTKDMTPCLVDELKPLFSIQKIGTHYVKYESNYLILSKPLIDDSGVNVLSENRLSDHNRKQLNPNLIDKIKKNYIFKDLLCLSKCQDTSIFIRIRNGNEIPISIIDGNIKLIKIADMDKSTYLSETIFKRWMTDDSPSKLLMQMLKLRNLDNIQDFTYQFKNKLDGLILRICPEYISLSDLLINKIRNKLFHLTCKGVN